MTEHPPHTEAELVEFVRAIDVRAPEALHRKVESLIAARSPGARRRGTTTVRGASGAGRSVFGMRLAGAMALAAVAGALVAGLSGGSSSGLSLREASALTLGGAIAPAPAHGPGSRPQLAAAVDGVSFPYWEDHFGWRATGMRSDHVDGRTITTVFYQDGGGRRIGYAIVSGTPAPSMSGGAIALRGGVSYRIINENGVHVICWLRDGHLCVVGARGVDSATLLRLASWGGSGAVAS